jgi:hypothetical protein
LYNAHLEPYGKFRGVATVRSNIENMKEGTKFRIGRKRSLTKLGVIQPLHVRRRFNLAGYTFLTRTILRLLKERHAIYSTGGTPVINELKWKNIGKSFFGPDSDICIRHRHVQVILRDLWFRGHSELFAHCHKWHFRRLKQREERALHPPEEIDIFGDSEETTRRVTRTPRYVVSTKQALKLEREGTLRYQKLKGKFKGKTSGEM